MKRKTKQPNIKHISLLLRVGLALVFLYAAIDALHTPSAWIQYIPSFSTNYIDPKAALDLISIFQIVLAAVLIWGRFVRLAAISAASLLIGIMVFNPATFLITFRDIGLVFMAAAIWIIGEEPA